MKGGQTEKDSLIGSIKCDSVDWVLFTLLQLICGVYLYLGLRVIKREYEEKAEAGYEFLEGDLKVTNYNIGKMIAVGIFGGMYATFSGIGAGMFFIP